MWKLFLITALFALNASAEVFDKDTKNLTCTMVPPERGSSAVNVIDPVSLRDRGAKCSNGTDAKSYKTFFTVRGTTGLKISSITLEVKVKPGRIWGSQDYDKKIEIKNLPEHLQKLEAFENKSFWEDPFIVAAIRKEVGGNFTPSWSRAEYEPLSIGEFHVSQIIDREKPIDSRPAAQPGGSARVPLTAAGWPAGPTTVRPHRPVPVIPRIVVPTSDQGSAPAVP